MRRPGALFASIGTSVMLVAAVTVSLLSVSAVFALGGFEGDGAASAGEALVLDLPKRSGSDAASRRSVEAPAVAVVRPSAQPRRPVAARRASRRRDAVRANAVSATTTATASAQVTTLGDASSMGRPPVPQHSSPPVASKRKAPNLGNGVRQLGARLSRAVEQTGTRLAETTTAPLGPTVSAAVQNVLNILAGVLHTTADRLGAVLGATP